MDTTAHFENISQEIAKRLNEATHEIVAAVAWFTDADLFNVLCKQAGRGLRVRLAVQKDQINTGPGKLNFQRLQDIGGEVFLIPVGDIRGRIMHHKFCVIDRETLIIGSYNWTKRAQDNEENIVVLTDGHEIAADYPKAFDDLLGKYGLSRPAIDATEVRRRLEIVRNLLLLDDWETLEIQLDRIRPANASMRLAPLFSLLDAGDGTNAAAWIEDYLKSATALASATDQEVAFLQLTLRGLEHQVTALSAEKAEVERLIHAFAQRNSYALGDLITRYLELRATMLRRKAEDVPEAELEANEANSAREDYEQYREAHEQARDEPEPVRLNPDDLRELKRLYRQASQKCHPDKVGETDREHANRLFVQLQTAYQRNDLGGVRAIHAAVREGNLFVDRSVTLTETESLGHAIAVLRHEVDQIAAAIHQLRRTETYQTLKDLEDWDGYFAEQEKRLTASIRELEQELGLG